MKESYVYLICDPSQNLFKIGVTKNLYSKRMKQLQTGNGCELHIVNFHVTFFPFKIESFLHTKFASKRERGEWFSLDSNDIASFKDLCQNYEKVIDQLKDNPFFFKTKNKGTIS